MAYGSSAVALVALAIFLYYTRIFFLGRSIARQNRCQPSPRRPIYDRASGTLSIIQDARNAKNFRTFPANETNFSRYGTTYRDPSPFQIPLKTMNAENIQAIFGNKKEWGVQPHRLPSVRPFCGEGFLTMDGVVWEHSRTLLQPTLHKDRISNLGFFEKSLEQCITQIPGDGSTIDVQPLLSNLFIDTAANSLLGHPLGMMGETQLRHSPIDGKKFQKAFMLSLRGCAMRLELGIFAYFLPRSMTSDNWSVVHQLVDYCIDEAFKRKGQANVRDHDSLLDDLVEKTDDKLVIRNLVIQAMMASQDTTPTLIANAIFLLARSPSVWARLREEVATIKPGNYTPDNARKSKLLHHILLESLRLCPVFSTFNRVALRHTTLPTGGGPTKDRPIFVPAGTVVAADFYALHRDKSFYGPNAESFDPDRWQHMQAGPWHYMGFGGGPRACLGKQKALTEASCALIRFAQAFSRIESRDSNPWTGDQKLVAKNVHGCKVALFAAKI